MAGRFQGFAQEGLDVLQQVRIENDKTWFEEHGFIYKRSLLAPFELVGKSYKRLRAKDLDPTS